jgi:hypothetical protein
MEKQMAVCLNQEGINQTVPDVSNGKINAHLMNINCYRMLSK